MQSPPEDYQPPLLTVHHTNWMSAEESPDIVQELIDREVAAGWVQAFSGTLAEAQSFLESGLGKLGLALSDSRPPQLVLDSTICGVNPQCIMPERTMTTLPTIRDVVRSHPLRGKPCTFDVRSAHTQIAVHRKYHGHLCFKHNSTHHLLLHCLSIRSVFSAHFWARLGGIVLRLFHQFCWLAHSVC
jgi:hypothetical protein